MIDSDIDIFVMADDEDIGYRITKKQFEYGYTKTDDSSTFIPKTSWCLTPYGYESDTELEGVHRIAFKCHTKQDKKVNRFLWKL